MKIVKKRLWAAYLFLPLLIPHLLFYAFSSEKARIRSDVNGSMKAFVYHLVYDTPYRNLFYHHIGRVHFLFSWILPRCPYTKINQDMPIGEHCVLEHAFCTFLNARSIGRNFKCFHNVTIGQLGDRIPIIGDNVIVSCGASVLGGITVGNNVVIGANAVVVKDVPDNSIVIGNPAVVRKRS